MPKWSRRDDCITGIECHFNPDCPFCGTPLDYFMLKVHRFGINDGKEGQNSHAIDFEFTCPNCGFWAPFGVAIDKEHFDMVKNNFDWQGARIPQ